MGGDANGKRPVERRSGNMELRGGGRSWLREEYRAMDFQ